MRPTFLLINPWVYDFAAANIWSRPLGLLRVAEYLSSFDLDLSFIDCMDIYQTKKTFGTGKYPRHIIQKPEILKAVPQNFARYGISIDDFTDRLKQAIPCDAVLITSIMAYWYPGVQKVIEIVKSLTPSTPVILGGIYPSLYREHASENSGADYIFQGHINHSLHKGSPEAKELALPASPLPEAGKPDLRQAIESLGLKLTGRRKPLPYYKLGLYRSYPFAPLLTSTGCPYRCSYCASSILNSEFKQRGPSQIVEEIRCLYEMGVRDYAFYDDALLVNADRHLKYILKEVVKSQLSIRFHCPNGVHARYIDEELASLMMRSGFTTLRLSLETVNTKRQAETGGKVTSDVFAEAVLNLKRQGFKKNQLGVYLMYGLPDQGMSEIEEGVDFLKKLDVRINLTEFSPIPGTSCWQELKHKGIITDSIDPLLTNNSVFSFFYSGYGPAAIKKLKTAVKAYNTA